MKDPELINGKWTYLGLTLGKGLTPKFKKVLEKVYQSVMILPNYDYKPLIKDPIYDIIVRGFEKIPKHLDPGGGFYVVKTLKEGEQLTEKTKSELVKIVCQNDPNCEADLIVREGPAFFYSRELNGQLIKDPLAKRVVWMRWRISHPK